MLRRRQKKSRLRRLAESAELDYLVLTAIAFNCVTMAFPPKLVSSQDGPSDFFCLADFILNCIFLAEFLIKFGALGFEYFGDSWNILDFAVVVQGVIAMVSECPNENDYINLPLGDISALRMIRILRPLKSLRKFPEMRLLVASLFGSFNLLLAILVLLAMAVFVLAVFASAYFGDKLDFRCLPDPYYDPFSGTFAGNPTAFGGRSFLNATSQNQYWESESNFDMYTDRMSKDRSFKKNQFKFLATNFWKSLSLYRDYDRDQAPVAAQFPYLASFCGTCAACRKCEKCYSDDPSDNCQATISGDFFRKYGHPRRIRRDFFGQEPKTAISRVDGVVSLPSDANELIGVPLVHAESVESADFFQNISYIREFCVDMKKGRTEQLVTPTNATFTPQWFPVTSPGEAFLDAGWQILTRFTRRLDLSEPTYLREKLRFRVKNCLEDRAAAKDAIATLRMVEPGDFSRDMNARNCRKYYAAKTGNSRFGLFGAARPRKRRFLWYHRFDATLWSMLTLFDMMNTENWNDVMWSIQDCVGKYTWPFFYAVIGIVNICLLNLFPAVMSFNLRKGIREEENRNALESKNTFMGTELHQLTQFEEHLIDILAAEEEEMENVRALVFDDMALEQETTLESLENVPGVPRGVFFETLRNIVLPETGYFSLFIYGCIFLNIAIMSQEVLHYRNPRGRITKAIFDWANIVFTIIFTVEILIKNVAMGPIAYFRDNYNKFDFVLGTLGFIDLVSAALPVRGRILALLRIVRILRVGRVFRFASLTRVSTSNAEHTGELDFWRLMSMLSLAGTWILAILGLLFLALYTASIVSMQIFGNEVYSLNDYSGQWKEKGRLNFDTFPMAFMTNFIVLTGDEWNTIMYNTMRKAGGMASIYFIVLVIIGRYAILSMLTAIIFEEVERDSIMVIKQGVRTTMLAVFKFERGMMNAHYRFFFYKWFSYIHSRKLASSGNTLESSGAKFGQVTLQAPPRPAKSRWEKFLENDKSYLIFPPKSRLRKKLKNIVQSAYFSNLIFVTIIVSVVLLARFYEIRYQNFTRGKPDMTFNAAQQSRPTLVALQRTCVGIFLTEFLMVTIADGLFVYLRDPMNCLDATITLLSFISLFVPPLTQFAVIRVIRIIRPMKKLARSSPAVTSLLGALESSLKGVFAVGIIASFLWVTIAVVGIQLFQGKLHYCSASRYPEGMLLKEFRQDKRARFEAGTRKFDEWPDPQFEYISDRFNDRREFPSVEARGDGNSRGCKLFRPVIFEQYNRNDDIVDAEGTFRIKNSDFNFDNLYQALRSAFLTFSFDDWHKLVLATMNAKTTGAYLNHEAEASTVLPMIFYFFAGWSSFLIQCLFVGVLYGAFTYRLIVLADAPVKSNRRDPHRKKKKKKKQQLKKRIIAEKDDTDDDASSSSSSSDNNNSDDDDDDDDVKKSLASKRSLRRKRRNKRPTRARLASLKDVQWRVYESKLECIQPLQDPPAVSKDNIFVKYLSVDPGTVFRHRRYKTVYGLLVFADVIIWWIYVGTQMQLTPKALQRKELDEADNSTLLRLLRTVDLVFCVGIVAEAVIKLMTFGAQVNIFAERLKFLFLTPVIVFLVLELSNSWEKLRRIDIDRDCDDDDPVKHTCNGAALQRAVYSARTLQVFLVIPSFVELRTLVFALFSALGITVPMLVLMVVATFAFAVIGMMFLGDEDLDKREDDGDLRIFGSHWFVTRVTFTTIEKSMSTLFIAATANCWIEISSIFEKEVSEAERGPLVIFFLVYVLLVRYLFLNVCTMIFIYKYESTSPYQPWIAMDQVNEFLDAWQTFDIRGDGYIKTKYLSRMLRLLSPPLGMAHDVPQHLADRHAKRILFAIPLLLHSEVHSGVPDRDLRWYHLRLLSDPHAARKKIGSERQKSKIPPLLKFHDVLKAVHEVVIFADKQQLPDDNEFTRTREFAQAKLDVLKLAIFRFMVAQARNAPGSAAPLASSSSRVDPSLSDLSLMQRLAPDVFRYRFRQALTLETHRWQKQIELAKFDEESFFECELLMSVVAEERRASQWQIKVLDGLAQKGLLNLLQERRPKLHRHVAFLNILLQRIQDERKKHIRRAWQPSSINHYGTLPVAPRKGASLGNASTLTNGAKSAPPRIVSSVCASASGDLLVSAHGGNTITVWRRRREKPPPPEEENIQNNPQGKDGKKTNKDPWFSAPYYKTQVETINLGKGDPLSQVVMTDDGKRLYASVGEQVLCYVRVKKGRGGAAGTFQKECTMVGHTKAIMALTLYRRYLFSTSDDGTVKIWRLRGADPLQSADATYTSQCYSLTVFSTASKNDSAHKDTNNDGLNVAVGMANGTVAILPFSLRAHWLQGAVWRAKLDAVQVCDSNEPVTALMYAYQRLFAGTAMGRIEVYRCVRGEEDKATLEAMVSQLRGKKVSTLNKLSSLTSELDASAAAALQEVVKVEHLYSLHCHADAVTDFCLAGGLFFSSSRDMAIVGWQKPAAQPQTLSLGVASPATQTAKPPQKHIVARVPHKAAVTCLVCAGDSLCSADVDGFVLLQRADKYREVVESKAPGNNKLPSQKHLEVKVIEKPNFFGKLDLATLKPRHFLAQILAHYYPVRALKKDIAASKALSTPHGLSHLKTEDDNDDQKEDREDVDDDDDDDDEQLDAPIPAVMVPYGENEDDFFEDEEDFEDLIEDRGNNLDDDFIQGEDEDPYEGEEYDEDYDGDEHENAKDFDDDDILFDDDDDDDEHKEDGLSLLSRKKK